MPTQKITALGNNEFIKKHIRNFNTAAQTSRRTVKSYNEENQTSPGGNLKFKGFELLFPLDFHLYLLGTIEPPPVLSLMC
jgi:hypothetical protein